MGGELEAILPDPRGLDLPRYRENPIYLFFEDYILWVISELSPERDAELEDLDLQTIFSSSASTWRAVVSEVLNLSDTIEIAIRDLWTRNREILRIEGKSYHPLAFAQDFVDKYFEEGSQVDIWSPESLTAAKMRLGLL